MLATLKKWLVTSTGVGWAGDDVSTAKRINSWSQRATSKDDQAVAMLNEVAARKEQVTMKHGQSALYLHVDDGLMFSGGAAEANNLMHKAANALEDAG